MEQILCKYLTIRRQFTAFISFLLNVLALNVFNVEK